MGSRKNEPVPMISMDPDDNGIIPACGSQSAKHSVARYVYRLP